MRIRSIKPEFWTSRTVSSVSWDARLVLKGLESYVDDNGAGRWDIELIVSEVFPRDHFRNPPETVARVSEAISELLRAGLIWKYEAEDTSRGGRTVEALYISNWEDLQRIDKPNKGRIRRPDGTLDYRDSTIRESSGNLPEVVANVPEKVAPVTGEQGSRGTGEQGNSVMRIADAKRDTCTTASLPQGFEEFWNTYPAKKGKQPAIKAYREALKRTSPETILEGARRYAEELAARPDQKVKYAQGWLNDNRWEDEPLQTPRQPTRSEQWLQAAADLTPHRPAPEIEGAYSWV